MDATLIVVSSAAFGLTVDKVMDMQHCRAILHLVTWTHTGGLIPLSTTERLRNAYSTRQRYLRGVVQVVQLTVTCRMQVPAAARSLILHMVQLDPAHRLAAHDYLAQWSGRLFPAYITTFLQPFLHSMHSMGADARVAAVHAAYPLIQEVLLPHSKQTAAEPSSVPTVAEPAQQASPQGNTQQQSQAGESTGTTQCPLCAVASRSLC